MNLRNILFSLALMISLQVVYAETFILGDLTFSISGDTCRVYAVSNQISGDITIPSTVEYGGMEYMVTEIGASAFTGCSSLNSVTIPNSVKVIGDAAFKDCGCLAVTIPDSVTSIGNAAFYGCSCFTGVLIPDLVTTIGEEAFYGCTALEMVGIGNSVEAVGTCAFADNRSIVSVTIGNSVETIGDAAFAGCISLTHVTVSWDTPLLIDGAVFDNVPLSEVTLHVPAGTEVLYQAVPVWKDFKLATSVDNEQCIEPTALLSAWVAGGVLHISGLRSGEAFDIYTIQGQLIYKGIARTGNEAVTLASTGGVYILSAGERRIKIYSPYLLK